MAKLRQKPPTTTAPDGISNIELRSVTTKLTNFGRIVDQYNASWTLRGDARHILETKSMRWWGRGSLGSTKMMTSTQA
ncbi:hypothetical protein H5410_046099 [Solanum commersonii]|uniref:Uncharacterized protein n=1 Tax=Solanum commersonii TaxID=4109 RepID=A0A9J5XBC3_SOLCO|nr:hypothetical protein H5410_046099 [Solanum commersonii]